MSHCQNSSTFMLYVKISNYFIATNLYLLILQNNGKYVMLFNQPTQFYSLPMVTAVTVMGYVNVKTNFLGAVTVF